MKTQENSYKHICQSIWFKSVRVETFFCPFALLLLLLLLSLVFCCACLSICVSHLNSNSMALISIMQWNPFIIIIICSNNRLLLGICCGKRFSSMLFKVNIINLRISKHLRPIDWLITLYGTIDMEKEEKL